MKFVRGRGAAQKPPGRVLRAIRDGAALAGHNAAEFDRLIWQRFYGHLTDEPVWHDSMPRCRRRGLPGGLDKIGRLIYNTGKLKSGAGMLRLLSRPQNKGVLRGRFVQPDKHMLSSLARYCATDVFLNAAIWRDENLGAEHADDACMDADRAINDRGIPVDLKLAAGMLIQEHENAAELAEAVRAATDGVLDPVRLRSQPQVLAWFRKNHDKATPNITAQTMNEILLVTDDPVVEAVCRGRLAIGKITAGKIEAIINRSCADLCLRGAGLYWGAHTGRWSHRGAQLGNLPKVTVKIPDFVYAHPDDAPASFSVQEEHPLHDILSSMLRGIFKSKRNTRFLIIDYSSVEARGTHWVAENEKGLKPYREGLDAYRMLAAEIFRMKYEDIGKPSMERDAGKVGVLAAGYQGGPNAIARMASKMGIDLEAAGIKPEDIVEGWRDANTAIAGTRKGIWKTPEGRRIVTRGRNKRTGRGKDGLWAKMKKAASRIAKRESRLELAGRCEWRRDGKHMACILPSGRPIIYRNVQWEEVDNRWGGRSYAITFESNRGGFRVPTYGGKLTENVVQAVCRDLLADAMVRIEQGEAGDVETRLHVHDELVLTTPKRIAKRSLRLVKGIMCDGPAWAEGFPLGVDGIVDRRYTKP